MSKVLAKLGCTKSGIKCHFIPTIHPELHVVRGLLRTLVEEDDIVGPYDLECFTIKSLDFRYSIIP